MAKHSLEELEQEFKERLGQKSPLSTEQVKEVLDSWSVDLEDEDEDEDAA